MADRVVQIDMSSKRQDAHVGLNAGRNTFARKQELTELGPTFIHHNVEDQHTSDSDRTTIRKKMVTARSFPGSLVSLQTQVSRPITPRVDTVLMYLRTGVEDYLLEEPRSLSGKRKIACNATLSKRAKSFGKGTN